MAPLLLPPCGMASLPRMASCTCCRKHPAHVATGCCVACHTCKPTKGEQGVFCPNGRFEFHLMDENLRPAAPFVLTCGAEDAQRHLRIEAGRQRRLLILFGRGEHNYLWRIGAATSALAGPPKSYFATFAIKSNGRGGWVKAVSQHRDFVPGRAA